MQLNFLNIWHRPRWMTLFDFHAKRADSEVGGYKSIPGKSKEPHIGSLIF